MSAHGTRLLFAAVVVAVAAVTAHGETVDLRSGRSVVGTVSLSGANVVVVDSVFPTTEVLHLERSEIAPESMHAILEHVADPRDAAKRREMGEYAESQGLLALAIADFSITKRLDPATATDMDARVTRLRGLIAHDMLAHAKDLRAAGHSNAAVMCLHSLRERFPDTEAARQADELAGAAHEEAGGSADVAEVTVSAADAPRVAAEVEADVARGDAQSERVGGSVRSTVADQRAAERAVAHYESAWRAAKTLPVSETGDQRLDKRILHLRTSTRATLVAAYATAAAVQIERRAIVQAEESCASGLELDPDNADIRRILGVILEARLLRQGGARR